MSIQKLATAPAFVVVDIEGQPATGQVRMARKILQSSAADMARSVTYSFASFGIKRSGASAGINAEGDAQPEALANFISELSNSVTEGVLHLDPAKGIPAAGLDDLRTASGRPGASFSPDIAAAGVAAATAWALGGSLKDKSVVIEGAASGPLSKAVADAVVAGGATIVELDGADKKPWLLWGADVDAVLCGSKLGVMNHQGAEMVKAKAVVPWSTTPLTTKAFSVLRRSGVIVVPDFVSAAGGLLAGYLESDTEPEAMIEMVQRRIVGVLEDSSAHVDGVFLGACYLAEEFLSSWVDQLPFGRPLAS